MRYSFEKAEEHYNKKEYDFALMHYHKLMQKSKGDDLYKCKYNIATILLKLDYYNEKDETLDECISMFKDCICYETDIEKIADRHYQIGVAYIGKDNYRRKNEIESDTKYLENALFNFKMAYNYNSDDKEIVKAIVITQTKIINLISD